MEAQLTTPPPAPHPRRAAQQHPRRILTGKRSRNATDFAVRQTVISAAEQAHIKLQEKKMMQVQDEIQSSASEIIQTGVGKLARNEDQRKRFRVEIEKSVAIPELLKDHLGFVHKLPSTLQLAALIGQKYLKSLQT